ncbi:MAG: cysteine desulfurase family protein [Sphingobacteriaceae bacterium]|nr:cysteine desulfurase family protein [Sphingobacteriaceae bacterium]
MKKFYFDNAATTPLHDEVLEAMVPVMKEVYGNPSSTHGLGRMARTEIEKARKTVAALLHCSPAEIFFTSGGTEADNMAIRCSVTDLGVKHIISSHIEHHAVTHTLDRIEADGLAKISYLKVDEKGCISMEELEQLLQLAGPTLVTLMHGNNEIGTMIDLEAVAKLCKRYGAYFHSDTVQTTGYFDINLQEVPVDFINGAAHKFNGPKGVGFIYIRAGLGIKPLLQGGAQERNMRGGTENIYGIVGLAKALEIACRDVEGKRAHISRIRSYMIEKLVENIPGVTFNGDYNGNSLYTVLNVSFPAHPKGEMLLFNLDIAGICASGGSACSSGSNVGSHVLGGIGVDPSRHNVRFSFGKQNTTEEVDYVVEQLKQIFELHPA